MSRQIFNRTVSVDGVDIFYREAGDRKNKSLLLLHGFPTSSLMFKNLMTALSDKFHLVAPDFPGFGFSAFPDKSRFEYTFENISACINRFTEQIDLRSFTIYLHDYGCAIGLRLCIAHPEKIDGIIVQNGNAYMEGIGPEWDEIRDFWEHPTEEKKKKVYAFISEEGVKWQYTAGLPDKLHNRISPELWVVDWHSMSKPDNTDMQFELNCDYKSNFDMFPEFQNYFRTHQPPALVIWGKHDAFFSIKEPHCYKRDLSNVQIHLLDGGHWALETNFDEALTLIENFMSSIVPSPRNRKLELSS
jgi:pimeloyl-ACP methyl ester carboxylesterase